jgi:glycosyltransferase involved in cell wall biosynthesis
VNDVLHYLGYDHDSGGIVSVVRNLAATGEFGVKLGLNHGATQQRSPGLPQMEFTPLNGEVLNPRTFWRSRHVAREVQAWLAGDPDRVFHGHSRAGMVVGNWLHQWGERRVVVSVHCYGRRRWFYRQNAARLGRRLFWLSPAMKRYYEIPGADTWAQCMPGGVPLAGPRQEGGAEDRGSGFRLVGVGAWVARKRWELVLEALVRLPDHVTFAHIGGGPAAVGDELRKRTHDLGLADRVTWRGPEPDSQSVLGSGDALVVASENEPLAMAMLEALAAGIPVIAADSGGAVDVVEPGKTGELFASGDAEELAQAVIRWRSRGVALEVPAGAWRFSATTVARQWAEVYGLLDQP